MCGSVGPVVAEIDTEGTQYPRDGRVPWQFEDGVVVVDVNISS